MKNITENLMLKGSNTYYIKIHDGNIVEKLYQGRRKFIKYKRQSTIKFKDCLIPFKNSLFFLLQFTPFISKPIIQPH